MYRTIFFIIVISLASLGNIFAQQWMAQGSNNISIQLSAVALIDIEPGGANVNLSVDAPTQAGNPVTLGENATDNSLWINYTSAVATNGLSRSISVQVITGSIPSGLNIKLQAGAYSGAGDGIIGSPSGSVNLSALPQPIISGIRGAFTGDGTGNGHRLTYSLEVTDYGELAATGNTELTISYTITDN